MEPDNKETEVETPSEVLQIEDASDQQATQSLQLGESYKFDDLGPIIINSDGTTQRIANWKELSEQEKMNSFRLIAKRNKARREILEKQLQEQEQEQVESYQQEKVLSSQEPSSQEISHEQT